MRWFRRLRSCAEGSRSVRLSGLQVRQSVCVPEAGKWLSARCWGAAERCLQEIPTFGAALLADLAREIGMPQDISRAITGHRLGRDTHDVGYGSGRSLKSHAKWMAKIGPLAG